MSTLLPNYVHLPYSKSQPTPLISKILAPPVSTYLYEYLCVPVQYNNTCLFSYSIIEKGEAHCGGLIEAHKVCMRKMGFNV